MIRILSNGYSTEDFEFLDKLLSNSIHSVHEKCFEVNERCVYCPHRRACLDVSEVISYLKREGNRK